MAAHPFPFALPPRLDLARLPTPLQFLPRISKQLNGPRIWVKRDDLTGSVLSGNKVRKLEFSLAQAQAEDCDTIITCGGLQSNHCRATALLCAQLGLNCHLVLRGEADAVPDGNLLLDTLAGARIDTFPAPHYQARLDSILEDLRLRYAQQGHKAFIIPTGASDGIGVWGYLTACAELANDLPAAGIEQAHIVCASGSGGTQAGLTLGAALYQLPATVWGINVCDDEQWFVDKVQADIADWARRYWPEFDTGSVNPRVIDGYVGPGYAKAEKAVFQCIAETARLEGLVLDPVYTGKAFFGLLDQAQQGRFGDQDIIFIHTGGSFGLFPQREELARALQD